MSELDSSEVDREDTPPREDLPTHSEDGVDLTLIRWMLSLTPLERLQTLQHWVEMFTAAEVAAGEVEDRTVLPIVCRAREENQTAPSVKKD